MDSAARSRPFAPSSLSPGRGNIGAIPSMAEPENTRWAQWALAEDLLNPPGREVRLAPGARRLMPGAMPLLGACRGCRRHREAGRQPATRAAHGPAGCRRAHRPRDRRGCGRDAPGRGEARGPRPDAEAAVVVHALRPAHDGRDDRADRGLGPRHSGREDARPLGRVTVDGREEHAVAIWQTASDQGVSRGDPVRSWLRR